MYEVNVNGSKSEVTSYDAAKTAVKAAATAHAAKLAAPVRPGLFKSFKATARVNADRARSAAKLIDGIKLPKLAGDVSGNVGGLSYAIARR